KFRDELRARGGLLRLREFMMKDAYSFHATEEDFKKEYENMRQTYQRIFERVNLTTLVAASDNGYIGGEYCHEFIVESDAGESKFLASPDLKYCAHEDIAKFIPDKKNLNEDQKPLQEVDAVRGTTMEDGVELHKLPLWQQIKDVLFVDEKGRFILAIIRGDFDVNEVKLMHLVKVYQLRHATEAEIRDKIHSEPGFISPVGIKDIIEKDIELIIVADDSLTTIKNAFGGANKKYRDLFNMNLGRDYQPDIISDIALAKTGLMAPDGSGALLEKKGVEVGNIFQLGFHYSSKMKDSNFVDQEGRQQPYYMGCYGIGIARTMATIVELHHDAKGIIWPESIAPFKIHLVGLDLENGEVFERAQKVYLQLQAEGVEVLFDDRISVSAGEKFADADLIGIPYRIVISKKTEDKIEVKKRDESETQFLSVDELVGSLR
ncbi:MAG: proline--tRNA ligase, partial [Candidatus Daviesbacteria bacterium]|nr:proline--tRNA ligase [Candidatus Daviesbacteria bacterium]